MHPCRSTFTSTIVAQLLKGTSALLLKGTSTLLLKGNISFINDLALPFFHRRLCSYLLFLGGQMSCSKLAKFSLISIQLRLFGTNKIFS